MQSKMQEDICQAVSNNKNKNVLWGYYDICGTYVLLMEKEVATRFSILAWRIPWTKEPGGLQSTGSQRIRHD